MALNNNEKKEYTIEAKKHCRNIALIELKNSKGEVISDETLKQDSSVNFTKEFIKKCYKLAIDEILDDDNNLDEFLRFLKKMGVRIKIISSSFSGYLLEDDLDEAKVEFDEKAWKEDIDRLFREGPWN